MSRNTNRSWALMAACVVALAAGCSSTDEIEQLEVTLTNLEFSDSTLFETTMVATVRVANPNPTAFDFEGASFKLILDDRKVGTGLAPDAFSVDGLGSTVVDVTFHVNTANVVFRIVNAARDKREISYGIQGSLFATTSYGTRKLKVDKMGTLDLANIEQGPRSVPAPVTS